MIGPLGQRRWRRPRAEELRAVVRALEEWDAPGGGAVRHVLPLAAIDTGGLDLVTHLQHRRVDRIHRNPPDLLAWLLVHSGRHVATTPLDYELDLELALGIQGCDLKVGVVHLDSSGRLDVSGSDGSGTLLAQVHDDRLVVIGGDHELLEVQDDLSGVLGNALDGAELVQHTVDPDAGNGSAGDRGQQGAAHRVAECVPETGLEGFEDEARAELADWLLAEDRALTDEHCVFPSRDDRYMTSRICAVLDPRQGRGIAYLE